MKQKKQTRTRSQEGSFKRMPYQTFEQRGLRAVAQALQKQKIIIEMNRDDNKRHCVWNGGNESVSLTNN